MRRKLFNSAMALVFVTLVPEGCLGGERPFLQIQICLKNEDNLQKFTSLLRSVAESDGVTFVDASAETEDDLKSIAKITGRPVPVIGFLNVGFRRKTGAWVGAGNMGMPPNQVVLGFGAGGQLSKDQIFAKSVIHKIAERWHVEVVPPEEGARGMKSCKSEPNQIQK